MKLNREEKCNAKKEIFEWMMIILFAAIAVFILDT